MIRGRSAAGKSSLALQLLALGGKLVADDRTEVRLAQTGRPIASAPAAIRGLIEARGIGLLRVPAAGPTEIAAVIDLDHAEAERLPPLRKADVLGVPVPLLFKVQAPYFAASVVLFLRHGRSE